MCRTEFGVLPVGDVINWHNEDFIQPNTASLEKLVVLTVYSNLVYMMRLTALWHRGFALFCGGRNAYVQMRSSLIIIVQRVQYKQTTQCIENSAVRESYRETVQSAEIISLISAT